MAGHSKWANIKHRKARQDQARGKMWSKCSRAIIVAAKAGGGDPEMNLGSLRGNLGALHYDAGRYQDAYDIWTTVPGAKEDMDPTWDSFIGLMKGGALEAFPDSFRASLSPEDMLHLGEPDRAANRLSNPPGGDWVGALYRVWSPIFDPIRQHPAMQEFMAAHGLGSVTAQRTPPDQRVLPAVLRAAQTEAGP